MTGLAIGRAIDAVDVLLDGHFGWTSLKALLFVEEVQRANCETAVTDERRLGACGARGLARLASLSYFILVFNIR